jgi:hypothetical protein
MPVKIAEVPAALADVYDRGWRESTGTGARTVLSFMSPQDPARRTAPPDL